MIKTYAYHKPSDQGISDIRKLREKFSEVHALIDELAPASRERNVAFTQLETTAMWAIKSVVCNDPGSIIAE